MEGFQVDVILHSLRELQKGKSQNDRVLGEEYAKRKQIEAELAGTSTKLVAISDKYNKIKETIQIAELKVAQTQAQTKMFEQLNCERRDQITHLNTQMENNDQQKQSRMEGYETKMTELTDLFRTSWHTQSDDAMDMRQTQSLREKGEYTPSIAAKQAEVETLSKELKEAIQKQNEPQKMEVLGGVPEETWTSLITLFSTELKEAVRDKQQADDQRIALLTAERARLVKELDTYSQRQHNEE